MRTKRPCAPAAIADAAIVRWCDRENMTKRHPSPTQPLEKAYLGETVVLVCQDFSGNSIEEQNRNQPSNSELPFCSVRDLGQKDLRNM